MLTVKSNQILTAVVQGMRKEEPNNDVRRAATVALNNALESVKSNFDNATERDYIMQTVCEGCVAESHTVRIAAYECIVKIATLYYHHLSAYMQALFQLTFEEIKTGRDEVAQQAVEFWSTVSPRCPHCPRCPRPLALRCARRAAPGDDEAGGGGIVG
mgnify:CR=1 FL=1